uniref:CCHC-type domain-containing protein n=1 Tax=Chenopodium quinoa TaxID=63459 RepID=A0A803MYZ3_CHEQI
MVATNTNTTKWIGFKYERLGDYCYFCGKLGHLDKDCLEQEVIEGKNAIVFQYGPFLVASTHQKSRASMADREKEREWVESLANRKQSHRVTYNNPNAIRLGPPSAARRLHFSSPGNTSIVPKAREVSLRAVVDESSNKIVLRPGSVSSQLSTEELRDSIEPMGVSEGDKEKESELGIKTQVREQKLERKSWKRAENRSRTEGGGDFLDTSESTGEGVLNRKRGAASLNENGNSDLQGSEGKKIKLTGGVTFSAGQEGKGGMHTLVNLD